MTPSMNDPYYDQELGELRNLLKAATAEQFRELEPQIVFANELELESVNITRTNNLKEVCAIHAQLFKGVYDWAGEIRSVDIKKDTDHSEFFLVVSKIRDAANYVFSELANESYLQGLQQDEFIKRLAYFYDQLNFIHPFREGNGRAQRVFWSRVARDAGYEINWDEVVGDENDLASKLAAETLDTTALTQMFSKIVVKH